MINKKEARTLFNFLRGRGFTHRRDIPADLFGGNDTSRRKVRAICQAFPEHFVSTQDGYCITAEAPTECLRESIAILHSQANQMNKRAQGLQVALDRRISGQEVLL